MFVSENFKLQEFIPQTVYSRFGNKSIWFIDPQIIIVAQFFRNYYGKPITINDWHSGGKRIESGFRPPTSTIGAKLSQHRFGRAVDLKWLYDDMDMDKIRDDIKNDWTKFKTCGLTTIELGTDTWLHVDIRNTGLYDLYEVPYWKK